MCGALLCTFERFFTVKQTRRNLESGGPVNEANTLRRWSKATGTRDTCTRVVKCTLDPSASSRNQLSHVLFLALSHGHPIDIQSNIERCAPAESTLCAAISPAAATLAVGTDNRDADAPTLPAGGPWSSEFREFLRLCLEKNPARRLGCPRLMETAFIQRAAATWQPGVRRLVPHEEEERKQGTEGLLCI